MKKIKYEPIELEIITDIADVITDSGNVDLPYIPF